MEALWAGLFAIIGTLLGSLTTYLLQRQAAGRADADRLRQERLGAYSSYAAALTDLKRAMVNLWHRRKENRGGADYVAARSEADQLGAQAEAARFRMQLLTGDARLHNLADSAFDAVGAIKDASDNDALHRQEQLFEEAVKDFIRAAAQTVR